MSPTNPAASIENISEAIQSQSLYRDLEHPEISHDRRCTRCALQCGYAVGPGGPDDLSRVKLIVISDYPGPYETQYGWPQVPNSYVLAQQKNRKRLKPFRNSGQLIRDKLSELFGLDPWSEVWFTNALRCDPNYGGRKVAVSDTSHIRVCVETWLRNEMLKLSEVKPTVPILCAGGKAVVALKQLYGQQLPSDLNLMNGRRRQGLVAGEHPLVITFNPAAVARCEPRLETQIGVNRRTGLLEVHDLKFLPNLPGTPGWVFEQDLLLLKPHL